MTSGVVLPEFVVPLPDAATQENGDSCCGGGGGVLSVVTVIVSVSV